jgi:hypothetical protein
MWNLAAAIPAVSVWADLSQQGMKLDRETTVTAEIKLLTITTMRNGKKTVLAINFSAAC